MEKREKKEKLAASAQKHLKPSFAEKQKLRHYLKENRAFNMIRREKDTEVWHIIPYREGWMIRKGMGKTKKFNKREAEQKCILLLMKGAEVI